MLITEANLPHPDDFFQILMDMHRDLTDQQSLDVNARLILLLSNHIGNQDILKQAVTIAREHIS